MDGEGALMVLYETVRNATSQDPVVMKGAEGKLSSWEGQPGFYSALANLVSTVSFDSDARFMAAVCLKNGVERHWRKAPNGMICSGIPDVEKGEIKRILEHLMLDERVPSITTQLAVTVGKIGRLEVPRDWPTLLPLLLSNIRSEDPVKQYGALCATYQVVKILSTKRLTGDRKLFQDVSQEIFDYLFGLWDSLFMTWAQSAPATTGDSLLRAHFALKILRILAIRGYKIPHESPSVLNFIPSVTRRAKETLELRVSRQDCSALLEKHVIVMWKIVGEMLETHPLSFVPFLQGGLEFAVYFGFSDEAQRLVFERVPIHAFNLLKGILLCPEFKVPNRLSLDDGDEIDVPGRRTSFRDTTPEANPLTFQAANIKGNFFTDEMLTGLVQVLVTRFLPLSSSELDNWNEDPEEFALRMEDSGEAWKYSLRQSAETLFVTLFKEYRKCVEIFLTMMQMYEEPAKDPADISRILAKDALYNAAGIVAYELYDEFCFDAWLNTTLVQELTLPVPILHRRITWLVGQWTGVKITPESRPRVFALLLSGLRSVDVVVRLSSSQALRRCLDDFDFVPEQLEPYMNETFQSLFGLLKDVRECDNKMRVLHTMSFMIERMGPQIKSVDQIPTLAEYLPLLWTSDHNMLKAAVVSTSIQLVHALGPESACLRSFLLPVIQVATDLQSPEHVYLLEDGLELWFSMMDYVGNPPDDRFLAMVDNLIPLLGISTEHLKLSLSLVNSYTLIYPEFFAEQFGSGVAGELNSTVSDMRAEGVAMILRCVETILRTSPVHGPAAIKPIVGKIFKSAYEALDTPLLMSLFLSVVSRLLLVGEPVFQFGLTECSMSTDTPTTPLSVMDRIVEVMCTKVLFMVQERKKLICLALLKLLAMGDQMILHRLCGIFLAVGDCLHDVTKIDANGRFVDSLCVLEFEAPLTLDPEEGVTENDLRRKRLAATDVVYNVDLLAVFRQEVLNLRTRLGEGGFNEVMSTVDVETMGNVKPFLDFNGAL